MGYTKLMQNRCVGMVDSDSNHYSEILPYEESYNFVDENAVGAIGGAAATSGYMNCGNMYGMPMGMDGVNAQAQGQGEELVYPTNGYSMGVQRNRVYGAYGGTGDTGTAANPLMDHGMDLSGTHYNLGQTQLLPGQMQSPLVVYSTQPTMPAGNSLVSTNAELNMKSVGSAPCLEIDTFNYTAPKKNSVPTYPTPISQQLSPLQAQLQNPQLRAKSEKTDTRRRYRVIRGVSAGGCSTRPPKYLVESNALYLPVELRLHGATVEDICYPIWSELETEDRRRIIRIERVQSGPKLIANFSIVGAANENPLTLPPRPDTDVIEVSCLQCLVNPEDSDDDSFSSVKHDASGKSYQYYITSVEVIEIVELIIGTQSRDPTDRRRERGRIRSNLVPFWSKKPISSRMQDTYSRGTTPPTNFNCLSNQDYRVELAKRIMGYEIRKPRGFDKEVRILRWDKLVPALKRALQSYYTEIPNCDSHLHF